MFCPQCNQSNNDASRFCSNCGTQFTSHEENENVPAERQAQSSADPRLEQLDAVIAECKQSGVLNAFRISGEVIEHTEKSETHISGSGGGGTVTTNYFGGNQPHVSGYTSPIKISTTITNIQKIWVRTESGEETQIELTNWEVQVRATHILTVIYVGNPDSQSGMALLVINHTTRDYWGNPDRVLSSLRKKQAACPYIEKLFVPFGAQISSRCPSCGYWGFPLTKKVFSTSGWIVLVLLLVCCFPVFWLAFLWDGGYDKLCCSCKARRK